MSHAHAEATGAACRLRRSRACPPRPSPSRCGPRARPCWTSRTRRSPRPPRSSASPRSRPTRVSGPGCARRDTPHSPAPRRASQAFTARVLCSIVPRAGGAVTGFMDDALRVERVQADLAPFWLEPVFASSTAGAVVLHINRCAPVLFTPCWCGVPGACDRVKLFCPRCCGRSRDRTQRAMHACVRTSTQQRAHGRRGHARVDLL